MPCFCKSSINCCPFPSGGNFRLPGDIFEPKFLVAAALSMFLVFAISALCISWVYPSCQMLLVRFAVLTLSILAFIPTFPQAPPPPQKLLVCLMMVRVQFVLTIILSKLSCFLPVKLFTTSGLLYVGVPLS